MRPLAGYHRRMKHAPALLLFAALLLLGLGASALTTPLPGATLFPSSQQLVLPFPAGNDVQIIAGYGPAMGSGLHSGITETAKSNDHYALDLVYANEPNSGKGLPITAPLAGTVIKAGWATSGWANYGLRVILQHDFGDGHIYHSLYAHMNAFDANVTEGATVSAGQVLGELGQSCQLALSCGSISIPHLHWSIHRDSLVGGSGTGGSYTGNAVVPEPLDGAEDLLQGHIISSTNTGMPVCGDGYCNGTETPESCPQDCPVCDIIPAAGRIIDESEALCFESFGGLLARRSSRLHRFATLDHRQRRAARQLRHMEPALRTGWRIPA